MDQKIGLSLPVRGEVKALGIFSVESSGEKFITSISKITKKIH